MKVGKIIDNGLIQSFLSSCARVKFLTGTLTMFIGIEYSLLRLTIAAAPSLLLQLKTYRRYKNERKKHRCPVRARCDWKVQLMSTGAGVKHNNGESGQTSPRKLITSQRKWAAKCCLIRPWKSKLHRKHMQQNDVGTIIQQAHGWQLHILRSRGHLHSLISPTVFLKNSTLTEGHLHSLISGEGQPECAGRRHTQRNMQV